MMTVRDIMHPRVARIGPDDTLGELIQMLAREGISGVPVVEPDCKLIGVVSVSDVLGAVADQLARKTAGPADGTAATYESIRADSAFMNRKVREIFTPVAFSVPPDTPVSELANVLHKGRMHRALVVDAGHLCGIVTAFDLLRAAAEP
jgi:CBS-domain-containing membrane protein